jgi:hypothetical protein
MKDMVAIDPGLQGTGLAFWQGDRLVPTAVAVVVASNRKGGPVERGRDIAAQIAVWTGRQSYETIHHITIVCELMEMHHSARARMMWQGDLQYTLVLSGIIAGYMMPCEFQFVKPSEWKGQLPKSVVERRLTQRLGAKTCRRLGIRTHAWDAVGIGMWARGQF